MSPTPRASGSTSRRVASGAQIVDMPVVAARPTAHANEVVPTATSRCDHRSRSVAGTHQTTRAIAPSSATPIRQENHGSQVATSGASPRWSGDRSRSARDPRPTRPTTRAIAAASVATARRERTRTEHADDRSATGVTSTWIASVSADGDSWTLMLFATGRRGTGPRATGMRTTATDAAGRARTGRGRRRVTWRHGTPASPRRGSGHRRRGARRPGGIRR